MSLKNIRNVKDNKIFQLFDIVIYLFLLLAVALMFVVLFSANKKAGDIIGLNVSYKNVVIATFSFEDDTLIKKIGYENYTEITEKNGEYVVNIYTNGNKTDYNILVINSKTRKVSMSDANCSKDKDCTYMSIKIPTDSIICIPHNLIITAITDKLSIPEIIVLKYLTWIYCIW